MVFDQPGNLLGDFLAVVQQVKDPALSLQWLRSLLRSGFDPWAGICHKCCPKKKKKKASKTKQKKCFNFSVAIVLFLCVQFLCGVQQICSENLLKRAKSRISISF